jgi:3-oxoacyl-(acyl-carrier-protein) synthase
MSHGLHVLARAAWPEPGDTELPQVAGFVLSSFNPLVFEAAGRCLRRHSGSLPEATAVIVASASGDRESAEHVARTVDAGERVGPLFFYQSVPNSIAGHVAARWGLAGPVVCLCPTGEPAEDGLAQAASLIGDGDAAAALIVLIEQSEAGGATALLVNGGPPQ